MGNMSYCRFQNTVIDFKDCLDAMQEMLQDDPNGTTASDLSQEEFYAMKDLLGMANDMVDQFGDGSDNDLPNTFEAFQQAYGEVMEREADDENEDLEAPPLNPDDQPPVQR